MGKWNCPWSLAANPQAHRVTGLPETSAGSTTVGARSAPLFSATSLSGGVSHRQPSKFLVHTVPSWFAQLHCPLHQGPRTHRQGGRERNDPNYFSQSTYDHLFEPVPTASAADSVRHLDDLPDETDHLPMRYADPNRQVPIRDVPRHILDALQEIA